MILAVVAAWLCAGVVFYAIRAMALRHFQEIPAAPEPLRVVPSDVTDPVERWIMAGTDMSLDDFLATEKAEREQAERRALPGNSALYNAYARALGNQPITDNPERNREMMNNYRQHLLGQQQQRMTLGQLGGEYVNAARRQQIPADYFGALMGGIGKPFRRHP